MENVFRFLALGVVYVFLGLVRFVVALKNFFDWLLSGRWISQSHQG